MNSNGGKNKGNYGLKKAAEIENSSIFLLLLEGGII